MLNSLALWWLLAASSAGPGGETGTMSLNLNQGRAALKRRAVTTAMLLLRRTILAQP